ncbi:MULTISPECIES: Hint domain-containing protein [Pseudoalteromonas]|uniref:Hint domain-containing protein n=1 Tax=Pseudoalteromonas amylolytica TaxID=1859457 RepID=A0A1S1MMS5_9GAMM|nr:MULTISPECIES: Hint domain-containing protein [Pseudoalteromonas]OHU86847.1 hypothetical protein BET10_01220 [Pseudoalteromonas amylolytica]OHU89494.1 hypothetical protein BFC16_04930 [Pseudoalteromonas sp. JW3]
MKILSLSIALALGASSALAQTSVPHSANPINVEQPNIQIEPASYVRSNLVNKSQNARLKARLAKYGLTKKNRPHLYNLIDNQLYQQDKQSESGVVAQSYGTTTTENCETHPSNVCSFFKHMGFEVATLPGTTEKYLVVSALNSERVPTNYTFIDLTLVDQNGRSITLPRYAEFFGDGTEQKRKSIYSAVKVDSAIETIKNAERIYADAWVTVVYEDANGNEVIEDRNSKVEYPRETLLAILGYIEPDETLQTEPGLMSTASIGASTFAEMPAPTIPIGSNVTHPADIATGTETEPKIIVCLNRNYGDCDYENIYPSNTPNGDMKLKVPFIGEYVIMGKVKTIYRPDWTELNVVENTDGSLSLEVGEKITKPAEAERGSNIFIQTKEGGGATEIAGNPYSEIENFFADRIEVEYIPYRTRTLTRLHWNITRNEGVFGDATLYGRYQDANWIMNIAVANEPRPGSAPRLETIVIGSTGMGTWEDLDHPPMQIVYSCLAKGSMILLPDGSEMPIEKLSVGDTVLGASQYSPNIRLPLEIKDISIGVEAIPMVKLTTREGKTLLLTESHPVITQAGQPVWAKDIKVADQIQMHGGFGFITKVERVKYNDAVYNLKLGRTKDDPKHRVNETFSMFANSVQVGDLATQSANEFKEVVETEQDVLIRLPESWHKDYLNSKR